MSVQSLLANSLWCAASRRRWRRFTRALSDPARAQEHALRRIVEANANTAFGREHHFDRIHSVNLFRASVPVQSPEEIEPWIERVKGGESRVLTTDPVERLVPTSGSTNGRKLIPLTRSFRQEMRAAIDPWVYEMMRCWPAMKRGTAYWSISPSVGFMTDEDSSISIGFDDDAAYLGGALQRLVGSTLAVHPGISQVHNLDAFQYLTLLGLLRAENLAFVSIWHPSFFTHILDKLAPWFDSLLEDVRDGGFPRAPAIDLNARLEHLAPCYGTPQRERADALRRIGPSDLASIWPELRVISCWTDASAAESARQLGATFPHTTLAPKGLVATEGFVSIAYGHQRPLAILSHFLEFKDCNGGLRTTSELIEGHKYQVLLTTGGGLYRYNLGDEVRVTGRLKGTPTIEFIGRADDVSDLCGEKLSARFVENAMKKALQTLGIESRFTMLAPRPSSQSPGYRAYLETAQTIGPAVTQAIEDELSKNPYYAHARHHKQLAPLSVVHTLPDAGRRFVEERLSRGSRLGEIKLTYLDREPIWDRWLTETSDSRNLPSSR